MGDRVVPRRAGVAPHAGRANPNPNPNPDPNPNPNPNPNPSPDPTPIQASQSMLDAAEASLRATLVELRLRASILRKPRAVGMIPGGREGKERQPGGSGSSTLSRESLDEAVLRLQLTRTPTPAPTPTLTLTGAALQQELGPSPHPHPHPAP